ncbi:MAG: hypothetical protein M1817_000189 [Caeruleum heppii]|nr:MAG: hypothetical protein M1817_000189 [Caeruleum heppii]
MSGRSALVRNKQANAGRNQHHSSRQQSHHSSHHQHRLAGPSLDEYLDFHPEPPPFHRRRSSSLHSGSPSSGATWVQNHGYQRRPPLPSMDSAIEKSTFRAFMDNKSDAFRSKLVSKFHKPLPDDRSSSSGRVTHLSGGRSPRGVAGLSYELPDHSPAQSYAQMPRSPSRTDTNGGYESSLRSVEQAATVKKWVGDGAPPQPWNRLRRDPELWDPAGDTLVYFGHETQQSFSPSPSFRIHAAVLEETESPFFATILREGYRYHNDFDYAPSASTPGQLHDSSQYPVRDIESRATNYGPEPGFPFRHPKPPTAISSLNPRSSRPSSPPTENHRSDKEGQVLHELYFPAPSNTSKVDVLRHHLTTRNVFAVLTNKSLVGLNLYQALLDLHERFQLYLPPNTDCAALVIEYLVSNRLDDLRGDPASAAGLLAWSEGLSVRWHEGWREAFVHAVGMYPRLSVLSEYRDVSPVSRALIERAHLDLGVRINQAEERLSTFDFIDLWPMQSVQHPAARDTFERCQRFLVRFYQAVYWSWPPQATNDQEGSWLTRDLIVRLQKDFGSLYDYFVDRDVGWDEAEHRSERKPRIVSKSKRATFHADSDDLPLTDMITGFDTRHKYPHLPHPYPLLPTSIPVHYSPKPGLFGGKKGGGADERATRRRAALAYAEATNIFLLGSDFPANDLVEAFVRFEKTDQVGEVDPAEARKGRWILLYCVLQVLSTLSVDTPNLRFKDNVSYFLNPRLRGTPPWREPSQPAPEEANQTGSHCWTVPKTWNNTHTLAWSGLRNHRQIVITSDGIGDGIGRASSASHSPEDRAPISDGDQKPRAWLTTPSSFLDDRDTPGRQSPRSSPEEADGKVRDWPFRPGRPTGVRDVREVGTSDYKAPDSW